MDTSGAKRTKLMVNPVRSTNPLNSSYIMAVPGTQRRRRKTPAATKKAQASRVKNARKVLSKQRPYKEVYVPGQPGVIERLPKAHFVRIGTRTASGVQTKFVKRKFAAKSVVSAVQKYGADAVTYIANNEEQQAQLGREVTVLGASL